jgi:prepilin-type N-terminal cleavage/methylation domain-containing protein
VHNVNGFSLIEVLVACAIFTIGLLGLVDAQLIALKQNQQTYEKSNLAEESLIKRKN